MLNSKIFIASSDEAKKLAKDVKKTLAGIKGIESIGWWEGEAFPATNTFIESLEDMLNKTNAGIFVTTPDDKTFRRGKHLTTARDNVIFEAGLFMGKHGRKRAAIIGPKASSLPTDLSGVTVISTGDNPKQFSKDAKNRLLLWANNLLPSTPLGVLRALALEAFYKTRTDLFPKHHILESPITNSSFEFPYSVYLPFLRETIKSGEVESLEAVEAIHLSVINMFENIGEDRNNGWFKAEARRYHWFIDDSGPMSDERKELAKQTFNNSKFRRRFLLPPLEKTPQFLLEQLKKYADLARNYANANTWFRIQEEMPQLDRNRFYIKINGQTFKGSRVTREKGIFVEVSHSQDSEIIQKEEEDCSPSDFLTQVSSFKV